MRLHVVRVAIAISLFGTSIATAQDSQQLQEYVGSYEQVNLDGPVTVSIQDGRLAAQFRGRPPILLVHVRGHEFAPEGMSEATIVFDVRDGHATGYTFTSPGETNVATLSGRREREAGDVTLDTRAFLEAFVEDASIPGLSVAVGVNGKIVFSEAFGYANIESGVSATPETRFRIASVSKALTGTAAALLAERGELKLDAPISTYLPDYPGQAQVATARQLAGHLSGLRHYEGSEVGSTHYYPTLQSALQIFAEDDLLFAPGTRMSYTTYGYTLLGAVMEASTGRDFRTLMREDVFEPLGMRHTMADDQRRVISNRSGLYEYGEKGTIVNAPLTDHSYKIPGGGFLSTAEDLVRFGSALLRPGILKRETLERLFAYSRSSDGTEYGYGMGWMLQSDNGRRFYGHGGKQPGGRSYLLIYPDSGLVLAILANVSGAPIGRTDAQLIAEPFDRIARGILPKSPGFDPVGVYELNATRGSRTLNATLRVWETSNRWNGSLALEGRSMRLAMVAVSGNEMKCIGFDRRLTVLNLEVDGTRVTGVTVAGQNSFKLEGLKLATPAPTRSDDQRG